ncbi:TetR/AcrR family transcriptional regulator [Anaerolentibacter hominis]|uniref:TetR/AcrR family transcriptional regulator n=1 Tax=Anaerolentibacter hominis TaxID=3079009 RepID=UPI0031B83DE6
MAPKTKITKPEIIAAALDIVREAGAESLNARAVAAKLNCSTQPVFSNFSTMDELRESVIAAADDRYQKFLKRGMSDPQYPPYKASGIYYIRFALEEKELFKLLFMRDRTSEEIREEREKLSDLIALIAENTGLSQDDAYLFHVEMWLYAHGIAVTIATSYLSWDWAMISRMLSDAYEGMRLRYQNRGSETE